MTIRIRNMSVNIVEYYIPETRKALDAFLEPPSKTKAVAMNAHIKNLVNNSIYQVLDAMWLIASRNTQHGYLNLINPGFNTITEENTPTFIPNKYVETNGSNNSLILNWNPTIDGVNYQQNNAMFAIRCANDVISASSVAGWYDGTDGITLAPRNTNNAFSIRINQSTASTTDNNTSLSGIGLFAANRSAAGSVQAYVAGTSRSFASGGTQASTAMNNSTLYLGKITAAGYQSRQFVSAYIGGSLNADQHATLYASDLEYARAIGAR